MHKGLLAALLLTALALAGCNGKDKAPEFTDVTCPDGTVVTAQQIEANEHHHETGFDPASMCPVPPKVTLSGLPASVRVYRNAPFTWSVDPGSVMHGHSMITEIRYATASVPDAQASITTYGKQVIKKEHQDLPVSFRGNVTFTTPGKVYVRAYAAVQGEGFDRRDVWSPEVVLDVLPVAATGNVTKVTHALGPVDDLSATATAAKLGDAVQFHNDDLAEHTLTLTSAPNGAAECALTAGRGADSADTCLLTVPGSYDFESNDVPTAKTLRIEVSA